MSQTPAETNRVKFWTKKEFLTSPPPQHVRLVLLHRVSFDGPFCVKRPPFLSTDLLDFVPETKGPLEKQPHVAPDAFFMMFRRSCQQKEPAWLQRRPFSCRPASRLPPSLGRDWTRPRLSTGQFEGFYNRRGQSRTAFHRLIPDH